MKRWRKTTWHSAHIEDEDGRSVCVAASSAHADKLVTEHNALIEAAQAVEQIAGSSYSSPAMDLIDSARVINRKLKELS